MCLCYSQSAPATQTHAAIISDWCRSLYHRKHIYAGYVFIWLIFVNNGVPSFSDACRKFVSVECSDVVPNSKQCAKTGRRKTITYYLLYTQLLIRVCFHCHSAFSHRILPLLRPVPHRVYRHCCWMKWYVICSYVCDCDCCRLITMFLSPVSHSISDGQIKHPLLSWDR